jgi:hypothetical protein
VKFLSTAPGIFNRRTKSGPDIAIDAEIVIAAALLSAALIIGLSTAADYGISIDEFNADDYGPKALAWYTSSFTDRSHFETVEFSLWYYGPWFQMLTAYVQSFDFADRLAVRHTMTFLVGLAGIAALLPIGRIAVGRWAGLAAIVLCLSTGYLYGSLFFTPIDVPFLAAMTWATLAIVVMTRPALPSWRATIVTGLLTGLALGTRTGGFITHAYLLGAMILCGLEFLAREVRLTLRYLLQMGARYGAVILVAWLTAIALWPWLQIGDPLAQFKIALVHFATIPTSFDLLHWGKQIMTTELPSTYVPGQLLARLPEAFLILLTVAFAYGLAATAFLLRETAAQWSASDRAGLRAGTLMLMLANERAMLVVCAAVVLPLTFLVMTHATIYDGIRHVLFVIPMLAVLAGAGFKALLPVLRRIPVVAAMAAGAYAGSIVVTMAALHPLEYVAMNALAGGARGAYGRFELDYWSAAGTEALRRLERRLDYEQAFAETPPSITICIPWREWMVGPMLHRPWKVETDPAQAEYIIETERSRCAANTNATLIDEVKRFGRTFAWVYAAHPKMADAPAIR